MTRMKRILLLALYTCLNLQLYAEVYHFVFRIDDFRLEHDTLQERIIDVFEKNNIPLVIGVIPTKEHRLYECMPDSIAKKWTRLINANLIEVALHGFYHEESTAGKIGEFTGALTYEEQFSRIRKGKNFIDSVFSVNGAKKKIHTFIPPWNCYDKNTVLALDSLHFDNLSGNRNLTPFKAKLKFLPCTIEDFDKVGRFNELDKGTFIILFHPYTFNNYPIEELDKLLKTLSNNPLNKFYTINGLCKQGELSYDGGYVGKIKPLMRYVFKDYYALNNHPKWEIQLINSSIIAVILCLILLVGLRDNRHLLSILAVSFFMILSITFFFSGNGFISDKYIVGILMVFVFLVTFIIRKNQCRTDI